MKKPSLQAIIKNSDRLVIASMALCIAGMGMSLPIFFKTTGLTLFFFLAPGIGCIVLSLLLYSLVVLQDFKKRHTFFKQEFYPAGAIIFRPGDFGDEVFLIKSGEVELFETRDGDKLNVRVLKEGDHFGEIAVFEKRRRKATALARSDLQSIIINQEDFEGLVKNFPEIRKNFLKIF
jgi:hypothetical protein